MQTPKTAQKVLFLITKATHGGAQKYVYDLATHLPYSFVPNVGYGERGKLSAALEERGIQTNAIPAMGRDVKMRGDVQSFFAILALIRQERPDVLHLNSSKAAAFGALAGVFAGVHRIIFTAHGWPFKEDRNSIARALIYWVTWFTVFCSHTTIVVSKRDLAIGRHMPLVGHKIQYVPLGIEPPQFLSRDDAWSEVQSMTRIENPTLPRIISVAELTKNKGLRYGIDAIAALKDRNIACNYFIIGSGELREELEEYAIEKEVETRIYFLGFVENASRLLKAFDAFLLPSIKEGTPYVLLEAAAAGIPVVATDVVDAAGAALVPPAAPVLLADALEHALETGGPAASNAALSLERMVAATIALYKQS